MFEGNCDCMDRRHRLWAGYTISKELSELRTGYVHGPRLPGSDSFCSRLRRDVLMKRFRYRRWTKLEKMMSGYWWMSCRVVEALQAREAVAARTDGFKRAPLLANHPNHASHVSLIEFLCYQNIARIVGKEFAKESVIVHKIEYLSNLAHTRVHALFFATIMTLWSWATAAGFVGYVCMYGSMKREVIRQNSWKTLGLQFTSIWNPFIAFGSRSLNMVAMNNWNMTKNAWRLT